MVSTRLFFFYLYYKKTDNLFNFLVFYLDLKVLEDCHDKVITNEVLLKQIFGIFCNVTK